MYKYQNITNFVLTHCKAIYLIIPPYLPVALRTRSGASRRRIRRRRPTLLQPDITFFYTFIYKPLTFIPDFRFTIFSHRFSSLSAINIKSSHAHWGKSLRSHSYLSSHTASLPFGQYQIILHSDRRMHVNNSARLFIRHHHDMYDTKSNRQQTCLCMFHQL